MIVRTLVAIAAQLDRWLVALMRRLTTRTAAGLRRQAGLLAGDSASGALHGLLEGVDAAPSSDELPAPPIDNTGYIIQRRHAAFLASLVGSGGVERVLEFGAGYSTVVLASALARGGGGTVTTIEQSPAWCEAMMDRAAAVAGTDVQLLRGRLRMTWTPMGCVRLYRGLDSALRERGPYDLVVIDAPMWCGGREGALYAALPHLRPDGRIVLDDAGRPAEQWALRRWLAACRGLRVELYEQDSPPHGIAVLRLTGSAQTAGSVRLILDSLVLAMLLAGARLVQPVRGWEC